MGVCGSKDGAESHTPAKRSGMGAKELVQTTIDQNKVCTLLAVQASKVHLFVIVETCNITCMHAFLLCPASNGRCPLCDWFSA